MGVSASEMLEDKDNPLHTDTIIDGESPSYTNHINQNNTINNNINKDEPPQYSEPYQPESTVINQNEYTGDSNYYQELPPGQIYSPSPPLPFENHPPPSMKNMSNRFKQYSKSTVIYPPKNGPIAIAKRLNIPMDDIPDIDPNDELLGDTEYYNKMKNKYVEDNLQLTMMGFEDEMKNLRYLTKFADVKQVIDLYFKSIKYDNIYIGDRVIRGIDWKWGNQDGGKGLKGTVYGLRQWHPKDAANKITEVVVIWDHGLYGNYRFGYLSAFDVQVVDRPNNDKLNLSEISVGQIVQRNKANWRWKEQDGGNDGIGIVVELYAMSSIPFETDTIMAVLWDDEKEKYKVLAQEYMEKHSNIDNEFGFDNFDEKEYDLINGMNELNVDIIERFRNYKHDPHQIRMSKQMKVDLNGIDEWEEWEEPDFEEILSRPIPKYKMSLNELEMVKPLDLETNKYLIIGDMVHRSMSFKKNALRVQSESAMVLKVEQQDPRCITSNNIRGDKIWTTWSSSQSFLFLNDGFDQIVFNKRGNKKKHNGNGFKVGDRVKKGNNFGTIVCLQCMFKINGMIAKVTWNKTNHINIYSWGHDNQYDLKKAVEKQCNYQSLSFDKKLMQNGIYSQYEDMVPSAPINEKNSIDEIVPSAPFIDNADD